MGVAGNGISNLMIEEPLFENWGPSAISGGLSGGLSGYQLAKEGGLNYWWGNEVGGGRNQWSFINSPTLEYRLDEYINNNYFQNELKLFYGDPDIKVGTNKNLEKFNARNVDGNIQLKDGRTANGFITSGVQRGENITNAARLMEFRAYQYNYLRTVNFMYLSNAWRYATFFLP